MLKSTELYLDNTPSDAAYPYLGVYKNDGAIVLFIEPETGIVVKGSKDTELGEYSKNWNEKLFEIYQHKIVLENDK